jgi:hypothetical protein
MMIYKFLGQEISINSANSVANSVLVRVVNPTTSNTVLLVQYSNGTTYASGTVLANSDIVVQKNPTDLLIGSNQLASPVAYKN